MCAMFRNASHFPSEGSLGGLISGLSGALRQVGDAAASVLGGRGVRMDEDGQGPFEAAVQAAAGSGNDTDAMMAALSKHSVRLTPLIKRRVFPDLPGVPRGVALGWAQLTSGEGATVSIGLFIGHDRFSQIALADGNGRVFVTSDPHADTHDMKPRFMLVKEEELDAVDGERFGAKARPPSAVTGASTGESAGTVRAFQGGIVGRDATGRMTWLASWLKTGNRYTLEQMRSPLPASLRQRLEYRDAISIAFLAAYMLPEMRGLLIGFGSGNIFRRLNREAPMGAIRRSIRDTMEARAHGMRASGLEDHFADLMQEAGALDHASGLEAVHGAEPLHLYTSSYSGGYFFAWDSGLEFRAALRSLRIEGNLNRFAAVSAWIERSARNGGVTEDTVTRAQAAQIDLALLDDPALMALPWEGNPAISGIDFPHDDGVAAIRHVWRYAGETADRMLQDNPNPAGGRLGSDPGASEWVYRQAVSRLLRQLRLPYRFDMEFRSNLEQGTTAVAFTTAGPSMMPESRYDERAHDWVSFSQGERAAMSAAYNLRVGLIIAALCFGASERVDQVCVRIDSIGLEEAVAEQDSAISDLMSAALRSFERLHTGDAGASKADPKDGDHHGDPSHTPSAEPAPDARTPQADARGTQDAKTDSAGESVSATVGDDDLQSLESFADMMKDINFEDFVRDSPQEVQDSDSGDTGQADDTGAVPGGEGNEEGDTDPMDALRRSPTVRNLVTVTFTRQELLQRLREDALRHPADTYRLFGAVMDIDERGGLAPISAEFDLRDARFSPTGSQEEPELSDKVFPATVAGILGTDNAEGLSIQRADLLQRCVDEFHRLAADGTLASVSKAQHAMHVIDRVADPELSELSSRVTSALIDGTDTPDFTFQLADELDRERTRARDLLFSGQDDQAVTVAEAAIERVESAYADNPGVPRYFNSYAERVVYNRLFATDGERTVLIPDNLFYAHTELADLLSQLKGAKAALPHLNAMVAYAPAYPFSHMKLAVQLARNEDWDSARAACLNALRVALDRDDAAFAYYRLAYAEWMRDRFDIAAAAYIMSEHIAPGQIGALDGELRELLARAESQCIAVPTDVESAAGVLRMHDLPVWPHTQVAAIVRDAARVCVDEGMFVPARTLSMAAARMNDGDNGGVDMVQSQFLRSLNS